MPVHIGNLLKKSGKTLSVAESCTGGFLGHRITAIPGSSDYFAGGLIAYADRIKTDRLGVSKTTLKRSGAVSEDTAKEMARNVRRLFKTDFGVSVTGIAGPGGGSKKKPVGLVYVAAAGAKKTLCKKYLFRGSRQDIKSRSAKAALALLRTII